MKPIDTPPPPVRTLLRVVMLAASLTMFVLPAHAQVTSSIPMSTVGSAPPTRSGTLPNGVGWSVNVGSWVPPQGYAAYPVGNATQPGPQVWTFTQPVANLRFGIVGLNFVNECVQMPAGIVAESISPSHSWTPGTRTVCRAASAPAAESIFTLAGPTTQLSLAIVGGANSQGRGPSFIEVTSAAPVTIDPSSLPGMVACAAVNRQLTPGGGFGAPYSFGVASGPLPGGLGLSGAGLLSGTPTAGPFNFTVTATDSQGISGSQIFAGSVANPPVVAISPSSLPTMGVNNPFSQTLTPSGGSGPYTFTVTAGALPAGLTLNAATGEITGTPTAAGAFSFTVTADGQACATGTRVYSGSVDPAPEGPPFVGPPSLPAMMACTAFSQTLTATGGTSPYSFALTAGALPAGLTFSAGTATISGTPAAGGPFSFTITANDSAGPPNVGSTTYSGTVGTSSTLLISPGALGTMELGSAFNQLLTASGGAGPFNFTVSSGALPSGLTLNVASGLISGTPVAPMPFNFTVTVTGANCATGSQAFSGTVSGAPTPVPTMPVIGLVILAGLLGLVLAWHQRRVRLA